MVTDDERREVAERLRGLKRDANNVTQFNHGPTWSLAWCVLGDELDECGAGEWFERMCARLADLIEPGESGQNLDTNRDSVSKESPAIQKAPECDREELLAEAKEAEKSAWYFALDHDEDELRDRLTEAAEEFSDVARRIREACGEVDE